MEPEAGFLKVCDLDGMVHCDALNEQIGHHEGMVAVDGLPSGDDASSTKETLAGQATEISAEQRLSVDSDVKGDVVDAEERAPATVGMETKASAEQRLSWDLSEADGAHAEERALPGTVSVKSEVSAEQRLPLVCSVDAGGYAEQRTLPGTVSEELKVSAEQRLSSSSENGISVVSAEKRVPMEVGDGEQQAFEEVQIAPSANSSVSMDRVYTEERAHIDPASTESHAPELEMHAEQRVLQQAAYSEQLASASDVNAEERTRQARVHAEQRVFQEGESSDPESLVGDTPCIRQFTWEEPAGVSMMVPVRFGDVEAVAVVDTAAQVTIMNHELRSRIGLQGSCDETVMLRNAKKNSAMQGYVWKHVGFQLGGRKYFCDIVEADISDALILGIDFLREQKCKIDLGNDVLEMQDGERVYASMRGQEAGVYHVSRVLLAKKAKVLPMSLRYVEAKFERAADVPFAIEPRCREGVFIPSVMVEGSENVLMCVMNMSDHYVTFNRNSEIGRAIETDVLVVPRDGESDMEPAADVYFRGTSEVDQSALKVCTIKQGQGLLVEDVPPEREGDVSSPEQRTAAGLCDVSSLSECTLEKPGFTEAGGKPPASEQHPQSEPRELPAHLRDMFEEAKKLLTAEQVERVRQVLLEFADVFATRDLDIGRFTALVHYLKTGQAFPIKQSMRRSPLGFEKQEKATLEQMLAAGVIEHSHSKWASPPVLVRKKDGSWRYCIDFRAVNNVCAKDAYPLPLIEECLDSLAGKKWFCTLDMNSGYWQIPIAEEDKCKTAFITKFGLFQFVRMPFGLCGAPATFQRAMHMVLGELVWDIVIVYLDDINVLGETFDETLVNLVQVLARFRKFGLKLKPRKCRLFCQEIQFLGRRVDAEGVHVTEDHIKTVLEWPLPKCRKDLECFLGFVNYHREFIQGMAGRTTWLYELTGSRAKWEWTEEHTQVFEELRKAMTSPPVLGFPNTRDLFILDTDASDFAIGAELSQLQDGKEQVISYASKTLNSSQRKYCTTRKELLSVVVFTRHYRHYLLCKHFVVRTDHASLAWLMRFKRPEGVLARWLQELSNYDFDIVHRSGKKHSNADGLSRIVIDGECDCYIAGKDVTTLPCGGCEVCTRMEAQWRRFEEDVDDVVPLAYGMIVPGQGTTTASVGVQVPGEEMWGYSDGCRLLEPGPMEEQGDSSPVTQEREM